MIATHNMQQARRVSHHTAFFYLGDLVEIAATEQLFAEPANARTRDYVGGAFG